MPIVNNQFNIILMTSVYLLRRICTYCSHRLRRHHFVLPWHACLPLGCYLSLSIRHGSSFASLPLFRSILVRLCQQYHYQCQPYYCISPSLHRTSVRTVASFSHGVTQGSRQQYARTLPGQGSNSVYRKQLQSPVTHTSSLVLGSLIIKCTHCSPYPAVSTTKVPPQLSLVC